MVTPNGAWNLDLFRIWVLEDVILHLISIPLPHLGAGSNKISWLPSSQGFASIGGAIWNHLGEWVVGFDLSLGICSIFYAELWGILDELTLI
ncbi:hypothetical protein PVK06_034202 [Gossypium arboreum]|uniref:Uncharacterized protein n=1 Tax=Gossypium arboreum TaxID=29729 RepID=A0ABR0NFP1_GOSAR|nr:hypothetical protein PVK06_034202 [Gossypium arboreum]